MKLALTKPQKGKEQRLVLVCDEKEAYLTHGVIFSQILGKKRHPVRKYKNGQIHYVFHPKYLSRIIHTMPHVTRSPGVEAMWEKRMSNGDHKEDIKLDVPGFDGKLWGGFQKVGIQTLVDNDLFMLNDEMGLGKTLMALCALSIKDAFPALCIVPNSVKWVWADHMDRFFPMLNYVVVQGAPMQRVKQIEGDADVTVINFEACRLHDELLADIEWAAVVIDEFHRIKNPQAKQTRAVIGTPRHRDPDTGEMVDATPGIEAPIKWAMSGTPVLNGRPEELWPTLHWQYPDRFPNYYAFQRNHLIKDRFTTIGYRNLQPFIQFVHQRSLRRRKDQVLKDLPAKVYSTRLIDLTAEQRRLYNSIRDELILWMDDGERKSIQSMLAQLTRLKQACFSPELYGGSKESAKVEEVKNIVEELVANGEKAIIFSQWAKATKILRRELGDYGVAYVDGGVKPADRAKEIKRFQEDDDCKLYIGTIGASKEGITLTAASYVIFTDKGWTPAENEQAAARAHRIGQTGTVNVVDIQARETVEQRIEALLERKARAFNMMIERDGGAAMKKLTIDDIRDLL